MPIGKRYDIFLNGKGYIIARPDKGRAWVRTGNPDTPSRRSITDSKYGELPDELDHPEVWDDWSAGFGYAYRRNGEPGYHWAENFDTRHPKQLVHAQALQRVTSSMNAWEGLYSTAYRDAVRLFDIPLPYNLSTPGGAGAVLVLANSTNSTSTLSRFSPTGSIQNDYFDHFSPTNFLENVGGRLAIFGSFIYVGSIAGSGFRMINLSDGLVYTQTTIPAQGFINAGNVLWRYFGASARRPITLRSLANSAASAAVVEAQWSASINVGNNYLPILDAISFEDQLCIGTPDGLYVGDQSGTLVNVLTQLQNQINEDNCRDLTIHDGAVIVPHTSGIFEYRPSAYEAQVRQVGPQFNSRGSLQGRFRAVRSFNKWLYAGLYTGSMSYLLAGDISKDKPVWHVLHHLPHTTKINRIHFDGITTASSGVKVPNRMWIATDASIDTGGTAPLYFSPIPLNDGNPLGTLLPFKVNYVSTARIDLGNVDFGAPSTPKVFRSVEVWADNLSEATNTRWALIYYDIDNSGSFTLLGTCNTSPKSTLFFPAGDGSYVTGQSIELSLKSFATDNVVGGHRTLAPIYRAIVLRGALRPGSVEEITAQVRIADNMRDRQGSEMRSGATMISELRALATRSTPVTLIDLAGATSYVSVLPPVQENETYQKGDDNPEIVAQVRMAVLTFS